MIGWILAGLGAATLYTAVKMNGSGANTNTSQSNKTIKIRCRNCGNELIVPDMFHVEGTCPKCHGNYIVENGIMRFKGMIAVPCISCGREVKVPGGEYVEAKCEHCGAVFNVDRGMVYNNTSSTKTSRTSDKTDYKQSNDTTKNFGNSLNRNTHRRRDYKEVLKKIPPQGNAKAGFIHDAKKQLYDGGAFWHLDELVRHFGGSTTTYMSYNARIKSAMTNGQIETGLKTMLEALEYARQKGDVSKYFYYRYMLGKWLDNFEDRIMIICMMGDYFFLQKDERPPIWVAEFGKSICHDLYTHLLSIDKSTEEWEGCMWAYDGFIHYLIENTPRDLVDQFYFHRGLFVFLSKDTKIHDVCYARRNELFSNIKRNCNNFELIKNMWEKEGYYI